MTRPTDRGAASGNGGHATVVATLRPPATGMTRMTERLVTALVQRGDVRLINLSAGGAGRRRSCKAIRSARHLKASLRILAGQAGEGAIYVPLNSGLAVVLDVELAGAARALDAIVEEILSIRSTP